MRDWDEIGETAERYLALIEKEEAIYEGFAETLQERVDAGEMTERAAKAVLQVVIIADDEDDWDLARTLYGRALMFPDWEPETLLIEDEELEADR
jgi:alkanesulfonate monooxygenase SsuD/methylene tetrahydromethanopterin reductase-like flavin-dependent oxidoreductase (luciferase family)